MFTLVVVLSTTSMCCVHSRPRSEAERTTSNWAPARTPGKTNTPRASVVVSGPLRTLTLMLLMVLPLRSVNRPSSRPVPVPGELAGTATGGGAGELDCTTTGGGAGELVCTITGGGLVRPPVTAGLCLVPCGDRSGRSGVELMIARMMGVMTAMSPISHLIHGSRLPALCCDGRGPDPL